MRFIERWPGSHDKPLGAGEPTNRSPHPEPYRNN